MTKRRSRCSRRSAGRRSSSVTTRTKAVIENELAAARTAALLPPPGPPPPPPSETALQVEEELTRVRNDRASRIRLRDELSKLQASLTRRREEITARRAEIRESLQSIEDEMSVLALAVGLAAVGASQPHGTPGAPAVNGAGASDLGNGTRRAGPAPAIDPPAERGLFAEAGGRRAVAGGTAEFAKPTRACRMQRTRWKMPSRRPRRWQQSSRNSPDCRGTSRAVLRRSGVPRALRRRAIRAAAQSEQMSASVARFKEITANTRRRFQNSGFLSPASEWWPPRVEQFGKPGRWVCWCSATPRLRSARAGRCSGSRRSATERRRWKHNFSNSWTRRERSRATPILRSSSPRRDRCSNSSGASWLSS